MIQFAIIPHAHLSTQRQAEIITLCSDAYEEDFAPYFQLLGEATHVLAMESDKVVSHAAWVPRELRLGRERKPLRCAYVEAVATPVNLQRKGLGTLVLRAIPPLIHDFDLAALSPSEPDFYARSGWEMWQGGLYYLHGGRRIGTPEEEVMVYRLPKTPADLVLTAELETDWRRGDVW